MDIKPKQRATPADRHIGRRLRMRRLTLDMSQSKLASALGVTFQQVQKYEQGTNRIGSGRLPSIAQALDVPVSFFFEGLPKAGEPRGVSIAADFATGFFLIPQAADLAKLFTKLDTHARKAVLSLARSLAAAQAGHPAARPKFRKVA